MLAKIPESYHKMRGMRPARLWQRQSFELLNETINFLKVTKHVLA